MPDQQGKVRKDRGKRPSTLVLDARNLGGVLQNVEQE